MAGNEESGDKTEKPTPHRLHEARKKGDVAKSKDVSATVGLLIWLLLFAFGGSAAGTRFAGLFEATFQATAGRGDATADFATVAAGAGWAALGVFLLLTAAAMIAAATVGTLTEFLQVGAVLTFEKMKPDLSKMNPIEGIKKMFSVDNLVELLKTIVKTVLLLVVTWIVIDAALPDILGTMPRTALPTAPGVGRDLALTNLIETGALTIRLLGWTLAVFLLVAVLDMTWQKHSYEKKMKMSLRDIREEVKQDEGDPHLKANRKQLHQEWASQNNVMAARAANVLVVNPTHIAIALDYDPDDCPVPVITGMGEGPLAQSMREAAEEAGVPVIQNIDVAREIFARGRVTDVVPEDMFDAIAQIIIWARQQRLRGRGA